MDFEELALKQQATDDRSIRNEARIKKLEAENKSLHDLATSVAVMAEQLKSMNTNVSTLKTDVEELKEKPAKRWNTLVDKIVWAIAAALIGFVLAKIGL
jgi:predicted nuclease with TOPRIM domain